MVVGARGARPGRGKKRAYVARKSPCYGARRDRGRKRADVARNSPCYAARPAAPAQRRLTRPAAPTNAHCGRYLLVLAPIRLLSWLIAVCQSLLKVWRTFTAVGVVASAM